MNMNKKQWQEYHGFTDEEMDLLEYLVYNGCKIKAIAEGHDAFRKKKRKSKSGPTRSRSQSLSSSLKKLVV